LSETDSGTVVRLEAAQRALRAHFLGWQCRLRQISVRQGGGRPSEGMCPEVRLDEETPATRITVLVLPADLEATADRFRHMARRTHDPSERYKAVLTFLSAGYYQQADDFTDEMTALFGVGSSLAESLLAAGCCALDFEQYRQRYYLPCAVRALSSEEPLFQATYWHNALFNPSLPAEVTILGFKPDWALGQADPPALQGG
jgi:hypothetical protein